MKKFFLKFCISNLLCLSKRQLLCALIVTLALPVNTSVSPLNKSFTREWESILSFTLRVTHPFDVCTNCLLLSNYFFLVDSHTKTNAAPIGSQIQNKIPWANNEQMDKFPKSTYLGLIWNSLLPHILRRWLLIRW